jgi:hypothetical protein
VRSKPALSTRFTLRINIVHRSLCVQAASQNDVNNIRDEGIRSALSAKFEFLRRDWNALPRARRCDNQFTDRQPRSDSAAAETEAVRRTRERWTLLVPEHRKMLTKYLHDEPHPDMTVTTADWSELTQVTKDALQSASLADWETFIQYGAGIELEEMFNAFSPENRRALIAGCGIAINSAEFNGIMQMSWRAYDDVPQRFTSKLIENMVQGIDGHEVSGPSMP